jgi:antitoxin CcdA
MKPRYDVTARKRPVNVTLNEDLVARVRELTTNLSGVIETLLAEFLEKERVRRTAEREAIRAAVATWNAFAAKSGSFADEHSML